MVAVQQKPYCTPEEYLASEREAEFKSEYLNGDIYAMAGSSPEHSAIAFNLSVLLGVQLRGKPCRGFISDMKVGTASDRLFSYPDLSVVCGEPRFHDEHRDVLLNPTLIVEVLSLSTERFDRGRKFAQYQQIESLSDYVLVAQDEPRVEHYVRQEGSRWLLSTATDLEGSIHIASIDCTLLLSEVYDKVTFPANLKPG